MILTTILLLLTYIFVDGLKTECNICIINSLCGDDEIHFNISVSKYCPNPMDIFYNYDTDIESEKHYSNVTIDCDDCYFDLTVDPIRDAWDYTLTLESPISTARCSVYVAHCGGNTSPLVWIITAGLTGIFILSGALLCIVRCYRIHQQIKTRDKKIQAAIING